MPLRIPFGRRKSSGNVLENVQTPPEPSFRVLDRPQREGTTSSAGGSVSARYNTVGRPSSSPMLRPTFEDDATSRSRGSGGTHGSSSSRRLGGSSSSSARLSSSTLPSSTDAGDSSSDDSFEHPTLPVYQNVPSRSPPFTTEPRSSFSFQAAGRTFSFGGTKVANKSPASSRQGNEAAAVASAVHETTRDRAMTASSYASTAKAPKLEASDFNLGSGDFGSGFRSGFGDMFEPLSKRKSTLYEEPEDEQSTTEAATARAASRLVSPPKLQTMRSWDAGDERKGLMTSPAYDRGSRSVAPQHLSSAASDSSYPFSNTSDCATPGTNQRTHSKLRRFDKKHGFDGFEDYSLAVVKDDPTPELIRPSSGLGRSGMPEILSPHTPSDGILDGEQVHQTGQPWMPSSNSNRAPLHLSAKPSFQDSASKTPDSQSQVIKARQQTAVVAISEDENIDAPSSARGANSEQTTPRPTKLVLQRGGRESLFDDVPEATLLFMQQNRYNASPARHDRHRGKVMTPQEFEHYRKQSDLHRSHSDAARSEEEDESDIYEEEDEMDRIRQEANQRQKQAASLAVHRQQMMKLTGENMSELPTPRSGPDTAHASQSPPNLLSQVTLSGLDDPDASGSMKTSDGEDEDVPLGILAAHGFPNKNRPPNRPQHGGPHSTLRSVSQSTSYTASPGPVTGESIGAGRGSLPVFARNLPSDPYFGANLVNHSSREAPAFGSRSAGSVVGTPTLTPSIPPGGLVGVIAGEERARALRRGSPNPAIGYGPLSSPAPAMPQVAPMVPQGAMGVPSSIIGMPGINSIPAMSGPLPMTPAPVDPTAQQLAIMQMQFQMMQMMQQMQGSMQQAPNHQAHQSPLPHSQSAPFLQPHRPTAPHLSNNGFLKPVNSLRPTSMLSSGEWSTKMLNPISAQHQSWPLAADSGYAPSVRGLSTGNGYAASIAPSERSNLGQPSRYRPVTSKDEQFADVYDMSRSATFNSATMLGHGKNSATPPPEVTIRAVERPKGSPRAVLRSVDDEDEEMGWEEMKRKRERKKFDWKARRGADGQGLKDLIYGAN